MFTTFYYVVTTYVPRVYYLLLNVYYLFAKCLLTFTSFYYILLYVDTVLIRLATFDYVLQRFTIVVYFLRSDSASGTRTQ